ncbi:MAG TPA: sugar phosphate isomerase/epimerase [Candidatus Limnocylindria bacterium]
MPAETAVLPPTGLTAAPIGVVPIVWNNVDLLDLAPPVPAEMVLDEIARLGFAGCQFGRGFPEGDELRRALSGRGLRLAERYCELPSDRDGLGISARRTAFDLLELTIADGGEVLAVALTAGGERDAWAGRARDAGAPRWRAPSFVELAELLAELAEAAGDDCRVTFHPHAATWVETTDEVDELAAQLDGSAALCLDVGHFLVGGGDPRAAVARHGALVRHVHLKDVDGAVLDRLRAGELTSFADAIRARIFTELGNGLLDLRGVLGQLAAAGYDGWLMVEQDSSWLAPAEAAAVGHRVLDFALTAVGAE